MAKRFPIQPAHPERNCWGCDRYCASDAMLCGNGSERTQHPSRPLGRAGMPGMAPRLRRQAPLKLRPSRVAALKTS